MTIAYKPIGLIHTPFKNRKGMPIQPAGAKGVRGVVEIFPEYQSGLKDVEGFSHLILIYHFHKSEGFELSVMPFMDTVARGVFATRAPKRPNSIGLSTVRLVKVDPGALHVESIDVLDGTPLLDVKPYVPRFDDQCSVRIGWLEKATEDVARKRADSRFT